MILWSESIDAAATEIKISFRQSKRRTFLECFDCSDNINAFKLETDKSMYVRVRYSQDHARAQDLKKAEHETGKKRARKLWRP
jgi:hypothetical protein